MVKPLTGARPIQIWPPAPVIGTLGWSAILSIWVFHYHYCGYLLPVYPPYNNKGWVIILCQNYRLPKLQVLNSCRLLKDLVLRTAARRQYITQSKKHLGLMWRQLWQCSQLSQSTTIVAKPTTIVAKNQNIAFLLSIFVQRYNILYNFLQSLLHFSPRDYLQLSEFGYWNFANCEIYLQSLLCHMK